jgi:HEAT repeat protein
LEDAKNLPPSGVAALVAVLRDPQRSSEQRSGVAEVLGSLATPLALEALLGAVEEAAEPWLRAQCAYRLGQTDRDVVLPRLALRLKYEKDYATAFWLADALGRFTHLAGVEGMLTVWSGTEDATLRAESEARLVELATQQGCADGAELLRRWQAAELRKSAFVPSPALRAEAWRWIAMLGAWNLRNVDDARFVLVCLEEWIVPLLVEALRDRDIYVRQHALQVLERRGRRAREAVPALLAVLDDPRLASPAALALGSIGEPRAREPLERALASPDPELAVAAASALGRLADARSFPALLRTFEAARALDQRQAAAQALLAIQDVSAARRFLVQCLTDPLADAGAAELALGAWLEQHADRDTRHAAAREHWRAQTSGPGAIPTPEELRTRRLELARLLSAFDG